MQFPMQNSSKWSKKLSSVDAGLQPYEHLNISTVVIAKQMTLKQDQTCEEKNYSEESLLVVRVHKIEHEKREQTKLRFCGQT